MSTLVVNEVPTSGTALQWAFTVDRDTQLKYVRLHLYRHLHPAGTVSLSILNAQSQYIRLNGPGGSLASTAITMDSIPTASPSDYWHGWVRFDAMDLFLKANQSYYFYMTTSGYTLGASFLGIVCSTEHSPYPVTSGMGYDFEAWGYRDLPRGVA